MARVRIADFIGVELIADCQWKAGWGGWSIRSALPLPSGEGEPIRQPPLVIRNRLARSVEALAKIQYSLAFAARAMRDRPQTYRAGIRRLAEGDVHASAMGKRIVSACDTACARCSNAQRGHAIRAGQ